MPGTTELLVIALVVFVLFGASKLPQLGSGLGKAISNFKGAIRSVPDAKDILSPNESADSLTSKSTRTREHGQTKTNIDG